MFVTLWKPKAGASLPDRSLIRSLGLLTRANATVTTSSCSTAVANVAVAVRPASDTLVERTGVAPPTERCIVVPDGVTPSSSASLKVTVSVFPFATAEANAGPVPSAGVTLSAVLVSPKPVTGSIALSASRSLPVAGAAYATVTVSTRSSVSARVSVTVAPSTSTAPVSASATLRSVPPRVAFTVNADFAGSEVPSSAPSKVMVSVFPFTDADENAGGVLFVTLWKPKAGASLPDRSLIRSLGLLTRANATVTTSSCATAVANVAVAVRPASDTLVERTAVAPPTERCIVVPDGVTPSSSASLKVTVSVFPFATADENAGPAVSPATLPAGRSGNPGSSPPPLSFSTAPLAGLS